MTLDRELTRIQAKPFTGYMTLDLKSPFHFLGILSPHLAGLRHGCGIPEVPVSHECAEQALVPIPCPIQN